MDIKTPSTAEEKKLEPKITKTVSVRVRPSIIPPTIALTGVDLFAVAEVAETTLPGVEEIAYEDTDAVVDDSVPFWTTSKLKERPLMLGILHSRLLMCEVLR